MPKSESESSKSMQDYLRAIAALSNNGDPVNTTEISRYFNIAPASVSEMLKKMSKKGYLSYSAYHGTMLTLKGQAEAQKITRKHRLLERFLSDVLHIEKAQVHSQACEMEHTLSDEAEESLCRLLKHPDTCSDDGKIIPACDLPFTTCEECIDLHKKGLEEVGRRKQDLKSICSLKSGVNAKVSFIRGEHRTLQRLLDMGLTPGTQIKIERVAPLKGPIEVCVRGSKVALGQDIAANVFVESVPKKA
jgi:DtxR family transcriptional regulator, Mn-dependent transcriptional regulator